MAENALSDEIENLMQCLKFHKQYFRRLSDLIDARETEIVVANFASLPLF